MNLSNSADISPLVLLMQVEKIYYGYASSWIAHWKELTFFPLIKKIYTQIYLSVYLFYVNNDMISTPYFTSWEA